MRILYIVAIAVAVGLHVVLGYFLLSRLLDKQHSLPLTSFPLRTTQTEPPTYKPNPPSLASVFAENHTLPSTLPKERIRTIIATGDIIPARSVNHGVITRNNPLWPYEHVWAWFHQQNADEVFINLEAPLLTTCPVTVEGMIFCGQEKNVQGLTAIGTTIANLANNHLGNHGEEGITETKKILTTAGIAYTGTPQDPTIRTIRGMKFAYLGFNDIDHHNSGITKADNKHIAQKVAEATQQADVVIVTYHFGVEYRAQPDERQQELAHLAIDSGADLVIGNHPHWIQPVEIYKDKFITYAHGNFIFDQMWSEKTKQGVIGKYVFFDDHLIDVSFYPLSIKDYGQAAFMEGQKRQTILEDMKKQSELLQAGKQ